jgi:hypothetical protein
MGQKYGTVPLWNPHESGQLIVPRLSLGASRGAFTAHTEATKAVLARNLLYDYTP